MNTSTDVTLPKGHKPVFPKRCIVCHQTPDSTAKILHQGQSAWFSLLLPLVTIFRGWSRVEFPICRGCKGDFWRQRWIRQIAFWVIVVIAVWFVVPHFKTWSIWPRKLAMLGLVMVALLPYFVGELFWPRMFDTQADEDTVTYQFASERYAREFANLNGGSPAPGEDALAAPPEVDPVLAQAWYRRKSEMMEEMLGKSHDTVMHAIIPFAVGGALDLYYYPNGVAGTGIATMELSDLADKGSFNKVFQTYELVMFTRCALSIDDAKNKETAFGRAHSTISSILNPIATFSAGALLNPHETCEFPADMDCVGGKCLIFDEYGSREISPGKKFGLLLIMEIHPSEMAYARARGGGELLLLLKKAGHYPFSDLDRALVC